MNILKKLKGLEFSRQYLSNNLIEFYSRAFRIYSYKFKRQYWRPSHGISSIDIETFGICNRKCEFCFNSEKFPKRKTGIMEETTYKKAIDELSIIKFKGRISPHFYGEPLLDKRLPMLIEYTKKKIPACFIQLSTNGDFLTSKIFKELVAKGVDQFLITNYDDEEKELLSFIGKKCPLHAIYRNYKDFNKVDRAGIIFNKKCVFDKPCLRPSSQLIINWKGDVLLCCNDFYGEYVMGNVNGSNLLDIWNSKKFLYYRNKLKKGLRSTIPICKNCDYDGTSSR